MSARAAASVQQFTFYGVNIAMFEFHISRAARDRYKVREVLFSFNGNAIFANPAASRSLAHRMNEIRGTASDPARQVQPGALFAMGLIDEAAHALIAYYRQNVAPGVMEEALAWFGEQVGATELDSLLRAFVERFPGTSVYNGEQTAAEWLAGSTSTDTGVMTHRAVIFEELLLLWFANANPSFAPFRELFDDTPLKQATVYGEVTTKLPEFFASQPPVGPDGQDLYSLLASVFEGDGAALADQLARLRARWGFAVGDLLRRMLLAGDVLKEEEVALWLQYNPPSAETLARRQRFDGFAKGGAEVPNFSTSPVEYEHFSPDQDWMPRTVLIAKSTYVWLHQLSRMYGREITRLDQIPDEELATLAARGLNALWLIGVWERSRASQTIKRLCGNEDAVASAYSLYDYTIAHNLGGDEAYRNLRDRCAHFGLRLASDMVPNHMGIDSTWVINHPEWFLSRPDSPYPAYSFNGPDLSGDDRVEIKIEDHYYDRTDAAVVFRRRDKWSGHTEYVYHGNDGTSFPWNDTAQLNYRSAAVREQVIQTILQVARLFPIIRFDAAMTLAKIHVQRLWFPTPGSGGSIPSRAESAMTTEEFDAALPNEFWREVVDRVATEVPGTLLLAEAFWLMEGYFVRTLGMHRVYNSAFMVMLRDEDNAKYREVLKKTLEFDPGIMKRYVNFMSNPDERTAIDQFGSGDKYFGVATMMATLPGLPMFGHGQVEGFTEKYGMEYYRPRYEETPNQYLVDRHNREIAPLLHNRALFAESENFLLYDLWRDDGKVDENVFAYSNRLGEQRALIVYHNHYGETRGTIHRSAAYMDKSSGQLRQQMLEEALALPNDPGRYFAYRESATDFTYLRRASDLVQHGIHFELRAYQYAVLVEWRELISDENRDWGKLCDQLSGRGVDDLEGALIAQELATVHDALRHVLKPSLVRKIAALAEEVEAPRSPKPVDVKDEARLLPEHETVTQFLSCGVQFLEEAREAYFTRLKPAPAAAAIAVEGESEPEFVAAEQSNDKALLETRLRERLHALLRLPQLETYFDQTWPAEARAVLPSRSPAENAAAIWAPALAWVLFGALGESLDLADPMTPALAVFDSFRLRHVLAEMFGQLDLHGQDSWRAAARVRIALAAGHRASDRSQGLHGGLHPSTPLPSFSDRVWEDPDVRWLAGVHDADGVTYFNKESFESLLWWRALPELAVLAAQAVPPTAEVGLVEHALEAETDAAQRSGYKLGHVHASSTENEEQLSGEPLVLLTPDVPDVDAPVQIVETVSGHSGEHVEHVAIEKPAAAVDGSSAEAPVSIVEKLTPEIPPDPVVAKKTALPEGFLAKKK
jgi:glycosidase